MPADVSPLRERTEFIKCQTAWCREQRPALRAHAATEDEDRVPARAGDSSVSHDALFIA